MANHCENYVNLCGDKAKLHEINEKLNCYREFNYFTNFAKFLLGKDHWNTPTSNELTHKFVYEYGTKWWNFYSYLDEGCDEGCIEISGHSAWNPPKKLIDELCKKYKLSGEMEYCEEGMDFGGVIHWKNGSIVYEKYYDTYCEFIHQERNELFVDERIGYIRESDEPMEELKNLENDYPYIRKDEADRIREDVRYALEVYAKRI
jgi:hypothetical protein